MLYQLKKQTKKTQVTRLRDTQTNNQASPSVFYIQYVQRSRVQTRQNREQIK